MTRTEAYAVFDAADEAWQEMLKSAYGAEAPSARHDLTRNGTLTSAGDDLHRAFQAKCAAHDVWHGIVQAEGARAFNSLGLGFHVETV